ncbi:single-stranded-DNA-specific exonuclease RecJ, partial [bacterium]
MMKRWKVKESSAGLAAILGDNLNILPLTAQLLINRGLADCGRASAFLSPELKDLHDPYLLKDMDRAVDRIVRALGDKEKIVVYGDYDVDGVTSSALLCLFFKELGCEPLSYIPQRQTEGYGLNAMAIKKLASEGVSLIITVDCGSGSADETALARSLGVDVVITDHHEMPDGAFASAALVNPKQEGCAFPFKGLAGIGVAFNLVVALRSRLRRGNFFGGADGQNATGGQHATGPNLKKYLDLVCIGTIADMVPLIDENRIFVSHGLRELNVASRPGIRALIDVAGVKPGRIDADAVAFQFAPRINAAGRLSEASAAFELLTTTDTHAAQRLARKLDSENKSRQKIEEKMLCEALAMIGQHATGGAGEVAKGLVLCSEKWHPGVIGIVASRLVERFGRPAVLIALENGIGRGSARSIRPFDMLEGLSACSSF